MNIRTCLLPLVAFALPLVASSATINIGFTPFNDTPPPSATYDDVTWNNLTKQAVVTPRSLVDSAGAATGVTVTSDTTLTADYWEQNFPGLPGAYASSWVHGKDGTTANPSFTFSGLNASFTYSFIIYAIFPNQAENFIRSGLYTATGANTESGVLDSSNNTSNVLLLSNVTPDANGSIIFSMMKDDTNNQASGYFQLNGLVIEATPAGIPEPSSFAALLGFGSFVCVLLRRRRQS